MLYRSCLSQSCIVNNVGSDLLCKSFLNVRSGLLSMTVILFLPKVLGDTSIGPFKKKERFKVPHRIKENVYWIPESA